MAVPNPLYALLFRWAALLTCAVLVAPALCPAQETAAQPTEEQSRSGPVVENRGVVGTPLSVIGSIAATF